MATNTGTVGTKEIRSSYDEFDNLGETTNLVFESSTVLSKERVGL